MNTTAPTGRDARDSEAYGGCYSAEKPKQVRHDDPGMGRAIMRQAPRWSWESIRNLSQDQVQGGPFACRVSG